MTEAADAKIPASEPAQAIWDARLRASWDPATVGCAGFGAAYNSWLYRLRSHLFRRVCRKYALVEQGHDVLDIGSGTGFYIDAWLRAGVTSVEGLDFSPSSVEGLSKKYDDLTFHLADIGDPDFEPEVGVYDVISAFDVLFHIVDDNRYRQAIENIAIMLKPGGAFLLSENFTHHKRPKVSDYHYSRTLKEIEGCLQDTGLTIEARHPMFVLMNAPDDSTWKPLLLWWRFVTTVATRGPISGWLAGALLFPLDFLLTKIIREGPTTEIAVCRKKPSQASHPTE